MLVIRVVRAASLDSTSRISTANKGVPSIYIDIHMWFSVNAAPSFEFGFRRFGGRLGIIPKHRLCFRLWEFLPYWVGRSLSKCGFPVPCSHPVGSFDQLRRVEAKTTIDEELTVIPTHNNIVLLAQTPSRS